MTQDELKKLGAKDILDIPLSEPERLFTRDNIRSEFNVLALRWHPDHSNDALAAPVLEHLVKLRNAASEKAANDIWNDDPDTILLREKGGKKFKLRFLKKREFELGTFYVCQNFIAYVVRPEFRDLYDNALRTIKGLTFANGNMEKEVKKYVPRIHKNFEAEEGLVLVVDKAPDTILLSDLLDHLGGKIEAKHVAWMMSNLHNFTCYLRWAKLTHNGISVDSCLISPENHTLSVLGGWWYAAPAGAALKALPETSADVAPVDVLREKKADLRLDLEAIRALGRELLGDRSGAKLEKNKEIPKAMESWLSRPGTGNAVQDYKLWKEKVLRESFGPPKFMTLSVSTSNVYKKRR